MANLTSALAGHKYMSLITFRKNGAAVPTPIWFAESEGRLYVFTRADSFKVKRIRNHDAVRVAACSMRGRILGPEMDATARVLPEADWPAAHRLLQQKYWLMRIPFLWSRKNLYMEITARD